MICPQARNWSEAEPCLEFGPASNSTAARINFLEANPAESQFTPAPQMTEASNKAQTTLWEIVPSTPSKYWHNLG